MDEAFRDSNGQSSPSHQIQTGREIWGDVCLPSSRRQKEEKKKVSYQESQAMGLLMNPDKEAA